MDEKRFALLIDADNISAKYIKTIMEEAANEGIITYKRIYGDWTKPNLEQWKNILLDYSINPIQQYAYTTGKNATDSAMIIDAMDILYAGRVEGFILVSSDSDFTRLAARLKEAGMIVIGMGKKQTPKAFVAACIKFKYLDVLASSYENAGNEKKLKQKTKKTQNEDEVKSSQTPYEEIINSIQKIIEENSDEEGWILISLVGAILSKRYSDFDVRNYGCKKLIEFLEQNDFEIRREKDLNNVKNPAGYVAYVRAKR